MPSALCPKITNCWDCTGSGNHYSLLYSFVIYYLRLGRVSAAGQHQLFRAQLPVCRTQRLYCGILCAESERVILLHICQPLTSARSCYCQLPVSGRNMQRLLQFRLGCHKLPIATGRVTGVARACRLCTFCDAGAVRDKIHLVFELAGLAPLRAK